MIRSLTQVNIAQKTVLLRLDFEVPLTESLPTLQFLLEHKARLVIILGSLNDPQASAQWVAVRLRDLLKQPVYFWKESLTGTELLSKLRETRPRGVLVLENLKAYPSERENDENFGRNLAQLGNLYVNEAFSLSRYRWASLTQTPKFLPRATGLRFFQEMKMLTFKKPQPIVFISGGVNILSSLNFIKKALEQGNDVLVGGKIADVVLRVKGLCPGKPWPSDEAVKIINSLELTNLKLHFPIDVVVSPDYSGMAYTRISALAKVRKEEDILDIGPSTVEMFGQIIEKAKTIIWHGPLGFCEQPTFNHGTKEIALAVTKNTEAYKIVGGEQTVNFLKEFGLASKMSFVSTGGRAMMDLVVGEKLPSLEVLQTKLKSVYHGKKN